VAAPFRRAPGDGNRGGCAAWLGETPGGVDFAPSLSRRRDGVVELSSHGGGGALRRAVRRAGEEVEGWVLWACSRRDRAVPGSDAKGWRQRDASGLRRVLVWHAAAAAPDGLARRACGRAWSGRGLDGAGTGAGPRSGGGTNRPAGPRAAARLRKPAKQGKLREHN
jgi:hypothetical protein